MAINQRPKSERATQAEVHERISRPTAADAKRLHVPVDAELHRAMKQRAVDEDRTIAEITRELWRDYLAANETSAGTSGR